MTIELDGVTYDVSGAPENLSRGILREVLRTRVARIRWGGTWSCGPDSGMVYTAEDAAGNPLWHAADTNGDPIFSGSEAWESLSVNLF